MMTWWRRLFWWFFVPKKFFELLVFGGIRVQLSLANVVKWDIFCDFHTLWISGLSFVVGHFLLSKVTHHVTMFLQFLTIWEWSYRSIERWVAKFNQQLPSWKFEYRHVNIIFLLRNFILASGRGVKSFIFPIYALLDFHLIFKVMYLQIRNLTKCIPNSICNFANEQNSCSHCRAKLFIIS